MGTRLLLSQRVGQILVEGPIPRPLNQPAARRIVASGGESQPGALTDPIDRLDEGLAKRRLPDDEPAVVILDGARHDFRSAGAISVHQHDQRKFGVLTFLGRMIVLVRVRHASPRVHDHIATRKELVRDLDRLVQWPSRVIAQIEEQLLHPLAGQLTKRLL